MKLIGKALKSANSAGGGKKNFAKTIAANIMKSASANKKMKAC